MKGKRELGNTGIMVSGICFGTLTTSPLQLNFNPETAARLFETAYGLGINFFDTAEFYDNYLSLKFALSRFPDMVISSRSYAVTGDEMRQSVMKTCRELDRDYIDIFGLHEVENEATLRGHQEALEFLQEAKRNGRVRAVAISTHTVAGVRAGASHPGIDVIHPLINYRGIGIKDGTVEDMIAAVRTARDFGKGIYAMKILGGGHLEGEAARAFRFISELHDIIDSVAVGMQSLSEIELNIALFSGRTPSRKSAAEVAGIKRSLHVASWCQGCGRCVDECSFGALRLENGAILVEQSKCLHCGYCVGVCPEFCLKVV